MNNKDYIAELAQQTGYSQDDTQKMVRRVIVRGKEAFRACGGESYNQEAPTGSAETCTWFPSCCCCQGKAEEWR